ncbi:type-F conjugative transfer system protein TraW [Burkholderia cepacia]|uniref:type-F conjugative transfer system protein TraW n=1 Tax=Burkholderia cepacia TaxID=292 RepID=UPI002AB627E4|nr:type-F conjugative transfer system protein TraW [Burkholderia cepacia]
MVVLKKAVLALAIYGACLAQPVFAVDVIGPVYDIQERDFVEAIQDRLKEKQRSGELARLEKEAIARSKNTIANPKGTDLPKATVPYTYTYDPSYTAPQNIVTPDGKVLATEGQRFNPLDVVNMSSWMIFFDGDDPAQVAQARRWMEEAHGNAKPILVRGKWIELSKAWKRQVYFDQQGYYVHRLNIPALPAVVKQDGKVLRIEVVVTK